MAEHWQLKPEALDLTPAIQTFWHNPGSSVEKDNVQTSQLLPVATYICTCSSISVCWLSQCRNEPLWYCNSKTSRWFYIHEWWEIYNRRWNWIKTMHNDSNIIMMIYRAHTCTICQQCAIVVRDYLMEETIAYICTMGIFSIIYYSFIWPNFTSCHCFLPFMCKESPVCFVILPFFHRWRPSTGSKRLN